MLLRQRIDLLQHFGRPRLHARIVRAIREMQEEIPYEASVETVILRLASVPARSSEGKRDLPCPAVRSGWIPHRDPYFPGPDCSLPGGICLGVTAWLLGSQIQRDTKSQWSFDL